ncbi:endolytic transglycosylase MltG [Bacillus sp. V59.32b]|uniref:endolytic transglycosylase MltG n=1 Tax=Bacillus sp. V59.32b TaxID=1758642 RepID=UPI0020B17391|nr:endolytic transglycosylase MltG [Bacillus sp. V59.32b]
MDEKDTNEESKMDQKDHTNKPSKLDAIRSALLERQGEAKVIRKVILITSLSILLLVIVIGLGGYFYVNSALKPVDPDNKTAKTVEIPIGSSTGDISSILEENGIIKNARVFKYYIKFRNEAGFQAGEYKLAPSMTLSEIVDSIKKGKLMQEATVKITIPEGKQLVQIANIIGEKTKQNPDEVFEQLNDKAFIKKMQNQYPELLTDEIYHKDILYPLEGYLYPATYDFYEEEPKVETIVSEMLKTTEAALAEYQNAMEQKKYSPHRLLTIASLVEEEATEEVDRGQIASVFFNRLEADMPLQTDPTVLYAKGEHKARVLYKDLEVASPYNTYKNKGLPPGPIANAGKVSIDATLNPANTNFLYFLATPEGKVLYSVSLDEHNQKKAEHITGNN